MRKSNRGGMRVLAASQVHAAYAWQFVAKRQMVADERWFDVVNICRA
jgi:hypothetical protein